jgi:IclR family mhp operon transcriptional activator
MRNDTLLMPFDTILRMPAREADDIQTLRSGIDTLRLLNLRESLSSGELADALDLSRAAAYRVLKTLHMLGYVAELERPRGRRYRLTVLVRGLSDGFDGDVRLLAAAQPLMLESTALHGWPLALVTPVGDRCIVRFNTDHATSRVIRRFRAGGYASMLYSAAGLLCLSKLAPATQRDVLTRQHAAEPPAYGKARTEAEFVRQLEKIREQDYATFEPVGEREDTVAVPLRRDDGLIGALTLRYMRISAGGLEGLAKKLVILRDLSARIEAQMRRELEDRPPAA